MLIDVKNGGADVENVDEDSICDYYLTPYQDHFHSLATELNCFCCNCLGSFFGHKCDIGQHLQVLRCLIKKRTLVCIFQFHNFCRKIALLKVNWGFMHHTLEIGSSSLPPSPAGLRTEIGMR